MRIRRASRRKHSTLNRTRRRLILCFSSLLLLCGFYSPKMAVAWEWSDLLDTGNFAAGGDGTAATNTFLSIQEVSDLRVRDIKYRLTRHHGYSADELGRILDKKELIHALAYEEEKLRLRQEKNYQRQVLQQGILVAVITMAVMFCWPLFQHAYEIASVNFVVYTDRKTYEISRCRELQSYPGIFGVCVMGILDVLQVWLTVSVLLSWFMKPSKYFFPIPRLTVRPAQFMGGEMANSSLAGYGINVGSMLLTWALRFVHGKVEHWTGRALAQAQRKQRKEARQWESADEKAARKAARKQAKLEKQRRAEQVAVRQQQQQQRPPTQLPSWMEPTPTTGVETDTSAASAAATLPPRDSSAHKEFLNQIDEHTSGLDDLD